MEYKVKIMELPNVRGDVKCFRVEKPAGYSFVPGQATDVSINKPRWEGEERPSTFTSSNEFSCLGFAIKGYMDHGGVTRYIHQLSRVMN